MRPLRTRTSRGHQEPADAPAGQTPRSARRSVPRPRASLGGEHVVTSRRSVPAPISVFIDSTMSTTSPAATSVPGSPVPSDGACDGLGRRPGSSSSTVSATPSAPASMRSIGLVPARPLARRPPAGLVWNAAMLASRSRNARLGEAEGRVLDLQRQGPSGNSRRMSMSSSFDTSKKRSSSKPLSSQGFSQTPPLRQRFQTCTVRPTN